MSRFCCVTIIYHHLCKMDIFYFNPNILFYFFFLPILIEWLSILLIHIFINLILHFIFILTLFIIYIDLLIILL